MDKEDKFIVQLVIGIMESDGSEICSFNLLDYSEIVRFEELKSKLKNLYEKGIEKIEEIKNFIKK